MDKYDSDEIINVGTGEDVTIKELATIVADKVNYSGKIEWDTSKPNGTPRKVLYVDKLNRLGFKPSINLIDGIASTYKWYLEANNCRR
jgi:GDP-L-fucose synthase